MKRLANGFKHSLSLLMGVVMIVSQCPLTAMAAGSAENSAVYPDRETAVENEATWKEPGSWQIDSETYGDLCNQALSVATGDSDVWMIYYADNIVDSTAAHYSYIGVLYSKTADAVFAGSASVSASDLPGTYSFSGMFGNLNSESEVWLKGLTSGTYNYRIVVAVEDGNNNISSYHFVTQPGSFTCGNAPAVITSTEVYEYGYGYEDVQINLDQSVLDEDNGEVIEEIRIITDYSNEIIDVDAGASSVTRNISNSFDSAYAVAVLMSGNGYGTRRLSNSVPVEKKVKDATEARTRFEMTPGHGNLTFTATLEPYFYSDAIWGYAYIRKKGSDAWTNNGGYMHFENGSTYTYRFTGLDPGAVYEWYADIEVAQSNIVLGTTGTKAVPNEVTVYADPVLAADDFTSSELYGYLSSNGFLKGKTLTQGLLETYDELTITGDEVKGLDDNALSDIVDKFPNLERLTFTDQDITDITPLMGLSKLISIDLRGNDIKDLPDGFYEKFDGPWVNLSHNLLSEKDEDDLRDAYGTAMPQDTKEIEIESRQYTSNGKKQLYFTYDHGNVKKAYDFYLSVDGAEAQQVEVYRSIDVSDYYHSDRYFLAPDISALTGDKKECDVTLTIKRGETVLASGSAHICYDDIEGIKVIKGEQNLSLGTVYIPDSCFAGLGSVPQKVTVSVCDSEDTIYAKEDCIVYQNTEPLRFKSFTASLESTANRGRYVCPQYHSADYAYGGRLIEPLSAGTYDIVISTVGEGGTELKKFTNKLTAIDGAYIRSAGVDRQIDNRGDSIALYVYGSNVDVSKIRPVIKSLDGTTSYTTAATAELRPVNSGDSAYTYTLTKGTNWSTIQNADDDTEFLIGFATDDGYDWVDGRDETYKKVEAWELKDIDPYDLMYVYYNCRKKALEVFGPAADFAGKNFSINTPMRIYAEPHDRIETASGTGTFDAQGRALVTMKDASGSLYVPSDENAMADYEITVAGQESHRTSFNNMHPWPYGTIRALNAGEDAGTWACVLGFGGNTDYDDQKNGYVYFYSESVTAPYTVRIYELAKQNGTPAKTFTVTGDKLDANGTYTFTASDISGLKEEEVYAVNIWDANGNTAQNCGFVIKASMVGITYDKGSNGTGTNVTEEFEKDSQVTLKGGIFTREGYKQTGWSKTDGGAKDYDLSATASFDVNTTLYPVWEEAEKPHEHTLVHHDRIEATKTTAGNIEYWECSGCGKLYSDADGKTEITKDKTVIPASGEDTPTPDPTPAPDAKSYRINTKDGAIAKNSAGVEVSSAKEGEKIDISWDWSVKTGYKFVSWKLDGATPDKASAANTSFVMGSQDVTVDYIEQLEKQNEVIEDGEFELPAEEKSVKVKSIKFVKSSLTLKKSDGAVSYPAEPTMNGDAEAPPVHYVTQNKDIVAVDQSGNFYPVGQGTTTVLAYCGKKKASCKVTVVSYTSDISIINESNEDLTDKSLVISGGQQAFLSVSFDPYDSTDSRKITWMSSNKKIVSVKDGILTVSEVKAETTVTITATVNSKSSDSGKISRTVTIRVIPAVPEKNSSADKTHKLSLKVAKKSGSKMSLVTTEEKNTKELTINIKGENDISEGEFLIEECISTNPDVVEVAMPGALAIEGKNAKTTATVTAKSPGVAYIVVKSRSAENAAGDRNVKRCKVTVTSPATGIHAESGTLKIEQSGTKKTITMRKGAKGTIEVVLDPVYSTDAGNIKIKASGGISYSNGIITAKSITKNKPAQLTVKCGKRKDTVYVTVTK